MRRTARRSAAAAILVTAAAAGWATAAQAALLPCQQLTRFNPSDFPATPNVDSRLLPLQPGAQRVLEGRSNVTGQSQSHRVTFTVTDLTKVIAGVRAVVVHDVDISSGQVTEEELAFFAQDLHGNVWNVGEYPEEYENGRLAGAPSTWLADIDGAIPGIHMPARLPPADAPAYLQGSVPRIDFLDCAQTFELGITRCVPAGCYNGVLVTDETSPLDPTGGSQLKSYAPGIGIVDVNFVDDPQAERLVLVEQSQLSEEALAPIREATLRLDQRGLETNATYKKSPAIEPLVRAPSAPAAAPDVFGDASEQRPASRAASGRVSLVLVPGAARVTRSGRAAVRVRCATPVNRLTIRPGTCRGHLDLLARSRRVGTVRFAVAGGSQRTVLVPLTAGARQALRRGARLPVRARTRGALAGPRRVVVSARLVLRG